MTDQTFSTRPPPSALADALHVAQDFSSHQPVRTWYRLCRHEMPRILGAFVVYPLKQLPIWLIPICTGAVVDRLASPDSRQPPVMTLLAIAISLALLHAPLHMLFVCLYAQVRHRLAERLRFAVICHLQRLSLDVHHRNRSGRLHSKILRDVDQFVDLLRLIYGPILGTISGLTIAVTTAWLVNPVAAVVFLIMAPASGVLVALFRRRMRKAVRDFRTESEMLGSEVATMLDMMPVTRAHGLEQTVRTRLEGHLQRIRKRGWRVDLVSQAFAGSSWTFFQLAQLVFLGIGAWLVLQLNLTIGNLVMLTTYFGLVVEHAGRMLNAYPQIVQGIEAITSLGEILEEEDVEDLEGGNHAPPIHGHILCEHLRYRYPSGTEDVLHDLSLEINAGQCVAIVGPSGSGKSTLLSNLLGLLQPTGGQIRVDGHDLQELNGPSFRQQIAYVPQEVVLFNGTLRENITYGLESVEEDWLQRCLRTARLDPVIRRLPHGLDTPIGERGAQLSGGERQRIAIARAMVRNPRMVILDEATASLDSETEAEVQEAVDELIAGRTTLIVAHRFASIRRASRIFVLEEGVLVEEGARSDLLASNGLFRRLYDRQR